MFALSFFAFIALWWFVFLPKETGGHLAKIRHAYDSKLSELRITETTPSAPRSLTGEEING